MIPFISRFFLSYMQNADRLFDARSAVCLCFAALRTVPVLLSYTSLPSQTSTTLS